MARTKNEDAEVKVAEASANAAPEYDYVVLQDFEDINDREKGVDKPRVYKAGTTVNQFGEERLNNAIAKVLVERRIKE